METVSLSLFRWFNLPEISGIIRSIFPLFLIYLKEKESMRSSILFTPHMLQKSGQKPEAWNLFLVSHVGVESPNYLNYNLPPPRVRY